MVFWGREGGGVWQMGRGDVSHTLAGITNTRVNTIPEGIDNEFYFLRQVQAHT